MKKTLYTNGNWKIVKRDNLYYIYKGRNLIDNGESFEEAYNLLDKYKKNVE